MSRTPSQTAVLRAEYFQVYRNREGTLDDLLAATTFSNENRLVRREASTIATNVSATNNEEDAEEDTQEDAEDVPDDNKEHSRDKFASFGNRQLPPPRIRTNLKDFPFYVPLVTGHDDRVKTHFVHITRELNKFESYMAEFFQTFGRRFNISDIERYLEHARQTIAEWQGKTVADANTGNLGRFCTERLKLWLGNPANTKPMEFYHVFGDDDEYATYLQGGHDILYWDMIMNMFHSLRHDPLGEIHTNMMLSMILSTFVLVLVRHRSLLQDRIRVSSRSNSHLTMIIKSVETRAHFLKSVLKANISSPEDIDHIQTVMMVPKPKKEGKMFSVATKVLSIRRKSKENTWYKIFASFIAFIMLAMIPGYIGFSKNWKDEEIGSANDADFLYLIQSSIVSTFGNLTTLMLLEKPYLSSPNASVWAAVIVGTVCNLVSIAIYPNFMPGWSALLGFIGTVSSASCVVMSTHAAVLERKEEVKEKLD